MHNTSHDDRIDQYSVLPEVKALRHAIADMTGFSFWFVRHGATASNIKMVRSGGDNDEPLSELGRQQCRELSQLIAPRINPRLILSSPLQRTLETAMLLSEAMHCVKIELVDGLLERRLGEWNGKSYAETEQKLRDAETPPGGEADLAFASRIADALRVALLPRVADQPLIVSSKGVARMLNALLGNEAPLLLSNAAAIRFDVSAGQDGSITAASHLISS